MRSALETSAPRRTGALSSPVSATWPAQAVRAATGKKQEQRQPFPAGQLAHSIGSGLCA